MTNHGSEQQQPASPTNTSTKRDPTKTPKSKPKLSLNAKFTPDQQVALFDKLAAATRAIDKERTEDAERRKWEGIVQTATQVHRAREERLRRGGFRRGQGEMTMTMTIEEAEERDEDGVGLEGEDGQRLGQEGDMEEY